MFNKKYFLLFIALTLPAFSATEIYVPLSMVDGKLKTDINTTMEDIFLDKNTAFSVELDKPVIFKNANQHQSSFGMSECIVYGEATANLSSMQFSTKLSSIVCKDKDGRHYIAAIDGWAVDKTTDMPGIKMTESNKHFIAKQGRELELSIKSFLLKEKN